MLAVANMIASSCKYELQMQPSHLCKIVPENVIFAIFIIFLQILFKNYNIFGKTFLNLDICEKTPNLFLTKIKCGILNKIFFGKDIK